MNTENETFAQTMLKKLRPLQMTIIYVTLFFILSAAVSVLILREFSIFAFSFPIALIFDSLEINTYNIIAVVLTVILLSTLSFFMYLHLLQYGENSKRIVNKICKAVAYLFITMIIINLVSTLLSVWLIGG